MKRNDEPLIVLFDGLCNFCSGTVRFILRRDRQGRFRFAPLQSAASRRLIAGCQLGERLPDSLIVVAGGRCLVRSDAALAIARHLRAPWPLLGLLAVLPRSWRDRAYDAFARRRYRWFGRRAACYLPSAEERRRFLADGPPPAPAVKPDP